MHQTQIKFAVPFDRSLYLLHLYNVSLVTCKGKNEKIDVMTVAWIIPASVNAPIVSYEY